MSEAVRNARSDFATERLLLLDNYDSFTFNLVQMFRRYPLEVLVVRSDRISLQEVEAFGPRYLVISPGPKTPDSAGISVRLVREYSRRIPILGVCLGMQCINEAFGGQTLRARLPVHGKTSMIRHQGEGLFAGVPTPFRAARYHSLTVTLSQELTATAWADGDVVMALQHPAIPVHGVQFHPESFLTEHGTALIENFLGQTLGSGRR